MQFFHYEKSFHSQTYFYQNLPNQIAKQTVIFSQNSHSKRFNLKNVNVLEFVAFHAEMNSFRKKTPPLMLHIGSYFYIR